MNTNKIQEYFDSNIPKLPFVLAGESVVTVNVATINSAKRLATSFQDFVHPDVLKFLEAVANTGEDHLEASIKAVMRSNGYIRFCFYLTVYCGRLELMLEMHAIQYLPLIGIPLESIASMEFYPCMPDEQMKDNSYGAIFGGDIEKLLLYCQSMKDNYIRVILDNDHIDISAIDILGYVERIA